MPICDICFGTCRENYNRKPEPLLSCFGCGISYHPSCLRMPPLKAAKCSEYEWRCKGSRMTLHKFDWVWILRFKLYVIFLVVFRFPKIHTLYLISMFKNLWFLPNFSSQVTSIPLILSVKIKSWAQGALWHRFMRTQAQWLRIFNSISNMV